MTRSTRALVRRGLAAAAMATFAAALTAGCSAGQQAQTAAQAPTVPGANAQVAVPGPEGGQILVRNAVVAFARGGYAKGATAPLELQLQNATDKPVRLVEVTSPQGRVLAFAGASPAPTRTASPTTASPSPTAARSPQAPGRPVDIEVPARGYVMLSPDSAQFLQLVGLAEPLPLGQTATLTFRFDNGATITDVAVPLTTPMSPAPRSPMVFTEGPTGHG